MKLEFHLKSRSLVIFHSPATFLRDNWEGVKRSAAPLEFVVTTSLASLSCTVVAVSFWKTTSLILNMVTRLSWSLNQASI